LGYTRLRKEMIERREAELNEGPLKVCDTCGIEKPLAQFHKLKRKPDGHYDTCKECRRPLVRAITLMRAWTMTLLEYDDIFHILQKDACNICGDPRSYGMGAMGVDHDWDAPCCDRDHPMNKGCENCIRGLLCNRCNILLGWLRQHGDKIDAHMANRPLKIVRSWRAGQQDD